MTRGVAHPPELRARVVAAVLAGTSVARVAAQFKVSKSLVSEWASADEHVRTVRTAARARALERPSLEEMLLDLVAEHCRTLCAELQAAARPQWLAQQNARDLAELVGAQRDTLLRLLAGFRPVDPGRPALLEPGASDLDPTA